MSTETMIIANQVEEPRSPTGEVALPCGYLTEKGELHTDAVVREITGHEEDMLGSDKIKPVLKMTQLIASCITRIGTITDQSQFLKISREMTIGDRSVLVLRIRQYTLGNVFPYSDQCPNPNCKEKNIYQVDLATLDLKKMPDPMKRVYDVTLPRLKATARFHVMTGVDEERVAKFQTDQMSQAILARLELLNGRAPRLEDVKNLHMQDRNFLREEFNRVEGGVDTEIIMTCPACGHEFSRELDIAQQGFFFPSQVQSLSKKKSSS